MPSTDADMQEIILQLKRISDSVISSEYLTSELDHLRENTDLKIDDLKEDILELKGEVKEVHKEFIKLDDTLKDFQRDMAPIIEFKQKIQSQVIKLMAVTFVAMMGLNVGLGMV